MKTGQKPGTRTEQPDETRALARRALRRQGIERRMALTAEAHETLSAKLCERLRESFPELAAMRVAFCWPVKNEPDLRPLMQAWLAEGNAAFAALLPVVVDPGSPLVFRCWTPQSAMTIDRYGIPTPTAGALMPPDAVLIPVNAFDAEGYRLGYGGGFFDRTLAALQPAPLAIGVGFELARVASIHPEAHDVRLDAIVTEAAVLRPGTIR
ncbi:MAG: 5-formyltetrahydrofolate cyclo-ligase [Propionivibrio sp.]